MPYLRKDQPINGTYYSHFLDYKYAILNHYNTKTLTEYTKKLKKGIATSKLYLSNRVLKFYFNRFFAINNKTKKKSKFLIMLSILALNNNTFSKE